MTFYEILRLPMSETDPTTVGEHYCKFINDAVERKAYGSIAACEFMLFFRVPSHPVTVSDLIYCLDMENTQFGSYGLFDSIKTYEDLIKVWVKARPDGE